MSILNRSSFIIPAVLSAVLMASNLVSRADSSRFDGPAELPRVTVPSALSDTPAPGKTKVVRAGEDLQQALNSASCGDTIRLQSGAAFVGEFRFSDKHCDDRHWIIVRADVPDSELPPEGNRITPCYGGIASLAGRPEYPCRVPKNALAKLVFNGRGGPGPVLFEWGANHYRLLGVEITRDSPGSNIGALVSFLIRGRSPEGKMDWNSKGDHIVLDRVWIHGNEKDETARGVQLGGSTYVAVIDSYLNDLKCIAATGACTDAQAVAGGIGDFPMGPYKIENNFLEASGESILLGGANATETPADIEVRHNHVFKPILWKPDEPGFMAANSGKPFIVKNLFELKNAQRVLFEGNILENTWGGFSQSGFAILLTPKNQSPNVCPLCRVTDITIRYSRISHCASGFQIANVASATKGLSTAGERYSIHDIVVEDIDPVRYKGFGFLFQIQSELPQLKDVKIDHITGLPPRALFEIGVISPSPKIANFTFTNSLVNSGEREISSPGGGPANCAYQPDKQGPAGVFQSCFSNYDVSHNVILNARGKWPAGNFTPKNASDAGLREMRAASSADFHLCREKNEAAGCKKPSPFLKAGSDGKPIGADLDAVEAATAGVQ
jgi:hypothetical protein